MDTNGTSTKRPCNVIAKTAVTCVVLSSADFSFVVSQSADSVLEDSMSSSTVLSTNNTSSTMSKIDEKNLLAQNINKLKNLNRRRITVYDNNGQPSSQRAGSIMRRFAKFTTEALFINLYARYYRELKIRPDKFEFYGQLASNIMSRNMTKRRAVDEIRYQTRRALDTDKSRRTPADIAFISGLISQRNALKDNYLSNWPNYQLLELCKKVSILYVPPLSKIIEVGNKSTVS